MSHRLFIDQNDRLEIAEALRNDGHAVVHASEVGMERREDSFLFAWAQRHRRTIITFDVDFAEYSYFTHETHSGIVRLKLEPQTPAHVIPVLRNFLAAYTPDKLEGALAIVTENKARLRRPK